MMTIVYLVAIALGLLAVGCAVSPEFRKKLFTAIGIRANSTVDSMTTDVEKEEYIYKKAADEVKANTKKVADINGDWQHQVNELNRLKGELKQANADYDLSVELKMGDDVVNDRVAKVDAKEQEVATQQGVVNDFANAAAEAQKALDASVRSLKGLETRIKSDAGKAQVAGVLRSATTVIEKAKDLNSASSEVGKISGKIDQDLERARAGLNQQKGTSAEQKFEELSEQARLGAKRKELEARRAAQQGTAAPSTPAQN